MPAHELPDDDRRSLIRALAITPLALAMPALFGASCGSNAASTLPGASAEPTLTCGDDDDDPTIEQTEGPFFTPRSPRRTSLLEAGIGGTVLALTGQVLTRSCRPIAGALLDFWQADDNGAYDNSGFRLRGHQFTGADGAFALETVVPGLYPGRTRHIHVKVQAPNRPILTTQLYFPGEARNGSDGIFHESLLMTVSESGERRNGRFVFVLDLP